MALPEDGDALFEVVEGHRGERQPQVLAPTVAVAEEAFAGAAQHAVGQRSLHHLRGVDGVVDADPQEEATLRGTPPNPRITVLVQRPFGDLTLCAIALVQRDDVRLEQSFRRDSASWCAQSTARRRDRPARC